MDSHAFRVMGEELLRLLDGARVEKIHGPAPGVVIFLLFAGGEKRRLILGADRQRPFLFFSAHVPANPAKPSSVIMRLRKYASDHRLGLGRMDFSLRSLAFPLLEGGIARCHLLLDLRQGSAVLDVLPEGYGREPAWPDETVVDACCGKPWDKRETSGPWQVYSVLTPLLRETLAALDHMEGRALMADLRAGGQGLFLYGKAAACDGAAAPVFYCAWPLPEEVAARRGLVFLRDTFGREEIDFFEEKESDAQETDKKSAAAGGMPEKHSWPALEAVSAVDEPGFFSSLAVESAKPEAREENQEKKRLKRLLVKLDQEKKRLEDMLTLREDACLLQAHLWRFGPEEKPAEVFLAPEGEIGGDNNALRRITLDPLLTVRENMQRMFRQSARGARGLSMLAQRRQIIEQESVDRDAAVPGMNVSVEGGAGDYTAAGMGALGASSTAGKAARADAGPDRPGKPAGRQELKNIALFRSSDGYTLLRGKNARGNQALLKLGQPYDLWLHARGGPSAHLIIRKAHAADEVPERTLREAAILVGQKSWQQGAAKADIMVAYVKHVHPIKGAAPGTVRVDGELPGLTVSLDSLPERISSEE